jgi:hypothetical protein
VRAAPRIPLSPEMWEILVEPPIKKVRGHLIVRTAFLMGSKIITVLN